MFVAELAKHLLNILQGIVACVATYAVFSSGGRGLLALSVQTLTKSSGRSVPSPAALPGCPAILMLALYSLWCWYGIALGVSLTVLVWMFWGVLLLLSIAARSDIHSWLTGPPAARRNTLSCLLAFAALYGTSYLFFTPTVSGADLPLASYHNNDVLHYVTFTRALQDLRWANVAGLTVVEAPLYFWIPASYYVLAFLGTFFRMDPMHAAMPALFGVCAVTGLIAGRISQSVFSLSRLWAVAIGVWFISGPFFRYLAGNYFFPALVSVPIVVHLIWLTTRQVTEGADGIMAFAFRCATHYVPLLFLYPVLLATALALQASIITVGIGAQLLLQRTSAGSKRRYWVQAGVAVVLGLAWMVATAPLHTITAAQLVIYTSHVGVAGWPLGFISPLAIVGLPGGVHTIEVDVSSHPTYVLGAVILSVSLLAGYFWVFRSKTTTIERMWLSIGVGSFVVYWIFYLVVGRSYQQWKLASYLPLPFSFVYLAAIVRLVGLVCRPVASRSRVVRSTLHVALPATLAILAVGANVRIHAFSEPPLRRFPASYANLARIDELKNFRDMYVEMGGFSATFMPVYFIRQKHLHLVDESYYPSEKLSLDRVSRSWPYFTQKFPCDAAGHSDSMPIAGVGCLLFNPPSPQLDVSYSFNRPQMFFTPVSGFGPPEPWGRWLVGHAAHFELEADTQRVPLDRMLYLNLSIDPYIPPRGTHQRLVFSWGAGRHATVELARREWVSIPLEALDWQGLRVRTVAVRLDMPDAVVPATVEASPERRALAVALLEFVLSPGARGRRIG
jgi:hypothetical protein